MADTTIASIPKNAREEIRDLIVGVHGHDVANLRVWLTADDGSMRPGNKGLAFKLDSYRPSSRRCSSSRLRLAGAD